MDLRKYPTSREVEMINVPAPLSVPTTQKRRSASTRNKKRKATRSSTHDLRRLSIVSSSRKFGYGSLKVCFVS